MRLDQPLSDKEFNELDQFLLSPRCGDEAMTMDALHGLFTALVIGPIEVPITTWLPRVWGTQESDAPSFKSDKEAERIIGLISRVMNEIAMTFEVAPRDFEPLFCEHVWQGKKVIDGESWAWGFWEGMHLDPDAWGPAWASDIAPLLRPIYLLGAEEIEEEEVALVDNPGKCHQLALQIEANLPAIQQYWQRHRPPQPEKTLRHDTPKTGRNAPCPCGSGKKFKQCCGAATEGA